VSKRSPAHVLGKIQGQIRVEKPEDKAATTKNVQEGGLGIGKGGVQSYLGPQLQGRGFPEGAGYYEEEGGLKGATLAENMRVKLSGEDNRQDGAHGSLRRMIASRTLRGRQLIVSPLTKRKEVKGEGGDKLVNKDGLNLGTKSSGRGY